MKSNIPFPVTTLALTRIGALAFGFIACLASAQQSSQEPQKIDHPPHPQSINPGFAPALYAQLRTTEGNLFFSPYSITEAMGMAHAGAKGETASEIASALSLLHGPENDTSSMQVLRRQVLEGANQKDDQLRIANALCIVRGAPLQSYQNLVRQKFDSELFGGDITTINDWVSKKTEGRIDKVLENLDPNTTCVLLNAVYFKGNWLTPFHAHDTHDSAFHLADGTSVKTKMMSNRNFYATVSNDKWIAVEMPYKGNCSMVLLMPTARDQFEAFEAGLSEDFFADLSKQLRSAKGQMKEIDLSVPKFKFTTSYEMTGTMKALGIQKAFDSLEADFTAMYGSKGVFISQIVHKAALEVDEQGSVAAAVTAVMVAAPNMPRPCPEVRFDRPFIVLITENTTNSTLFMGRISNPTAE